MSAKALIIGFQNERAVAIELNISIKTGNRRLMTLGRYFLGQKKIMVLVYLKEENFSFT